MPRRKQQKIGILENVFSTIFAAIGISIQTIFRLSSGILSYLFGGFVNISRNMLGFISAVMIAIGLTIMQVSTAIIASTMTMILSSIAKFGAWIITGMFSVTYALGSALTVMPLLIVNKICALIFSTMWVILVALVKTSFYLIEAILCVQEIAFTIAWKLFMEAMIIFYIINAIMVGIFVEMLVIMSKGLVIFAGLFVEALHIIRKSSSYIFGVIIGFGYALCGGGWDGGKNAYKLIQQAIDSKKSIGDYITAMYKAVFSLNSNLGRCFKVIYYKYFTYHDVGKVVSSLKNDILESDLGGKLKNILSHFADKDENTDELLILHSFNECFDAFTINLNIGSILKKIPKDIESMYKYVDKKVISKITPILWMQNVFNKIFDYTSLIKIFKSINNSTVFGEKSWRSEQNVAVNSVKIIANYDIKTLKTFSTSVVTAFVNDYKKIKVYTNTICSGSSGLFTGVASAIPCIFGYIGYGIIFGAKAHGFPGMIAGFFTGIFKGLTLPFRNTQRNILIASASTDKEPSISQLIKQDFEQLKSFELKFWELNFDNDDNDPPIILNNLPKENQQSQIIYIENETQISYSSLFDNKNKENLTYNIYVPIQNVLKKNC